MALKHFQKILNILVKCPHYGKIGSTGYTVRDIKKILGGNFKRVFREITG
ncbi:MAG: hypothetical protein Ct9H300mP29_7910 [Candidatus Neomarinimicrobiota bacterium]|nr:MAG: hypothetical protein Ct9H300mP29_7910 [Candidatus Neomarinimicrobiota bacterium]